jgi:hypothetical protein
VKRSSSRRLIIRQHDIICTRSVIKIKYSRPRIESLIIDERFERSCATPIPVGKLQIIVWSVKIHAEWWTCWAVVGCRSVWKGVCDDRSCSAAPKIEIMENRSTRSRPRSWKVTSRATRTRCWPCRGLIKARKTVGATWWRCRRRVGSQWTAWTHSRWRSRVETCCASTCDCS